MRVLDHELVLALILVVVLAVSWEIGFRVGWSGHATAPKEARDHAKTLEAGVLGILALLLGFTFSIAVGRYDQRKNFVVAEANAIHTAALRAELQRPEVRDALHRLFRVYVDRCIALQETPEVGADARSIEEEARQLQREIWLEVKGVAASAPAAFSTQVLILSVNDLINTFESRIDSLSNHVPNAILWLLLASAAIALAFIGNSAGLAARRDPAWHFAIAVLVAVVMVAIVDLDRPRSGLIRITSVPLIDLRETLAE